MGTVSVYNGTGTKVTNQTSAPIFAPSNGNESNMLANLLANSTIGLLEIQLTAFDM